MQMLGDWEKKQNQIFYPHQNQGENKSNKSKLACWLNFKKLILSNT